MQEARDKKKPLTPDCKTALYQRSLEDSEDIRFDYQLATTCAADKRKFCELIVPGRGRVIHCLESHLNEFGFSCEASPQLSPLVYVPALPLPRKELPLKEHIQVSTTSLIPV